MQETFVGLPTFFLGPAMAPSFFILESPLVVVGKGSRESWCKKVFFL